MTGGKPERSLRRNTLRFSALRSTLFELVERPQPPVFEGDDAVEAAGEIEIAGGDQLRPAV